jgi:hypothetical protein
MTSVVVASVGVCCLLAAAFLTDVRLGLAVLGGLLLFFGLLVDFEADQ